MTKITGLWVLIMVLSSCSAFAQISANYRAPSEKSGWWTLGLNAGSAFQTSDVCTDPGGWGAGLTLAKNLYYRPGSPIAFDLRGRLLYTKTKGLDHYRYYGIEKNNALNGSNGLDYLTAPGFVFTNYRTDMGELALEGVFTLNRLRERTGIILAFYGGIGVDWYRPIIDQQDDFGQYDLSYLAIDTTLGRNAIRTELKNILDGRYETDADGFEGDFGKFGIMPAAGIELGYQLSPRFFVSLGHKLTFSRTDLLDGQQWKNNNAATGNNDLHHYTSFDLKWVVKAGDKTKKPEITLREPSRSPYTSTRRDYVVRAQVLHVHSGADINFIFNGRSVPFDFRDDILTAYVDLNRGRNTAVISASNEAGSDREDILLFYEEPKYIPPTPNVPPSPAPNPAQPPAQNTAPSVDITTPAASSVQSTTQTYNIRAKIRNANENDVRLYINGRSSGNFNMKGEDLTATIQLERGTNNVRITAENIKGQDEDQVSIIYEVQQQGNAPLVTITEPSVASSNTTESSALIRANVLNINQKSEIVFKLNGNTVTDFDFNTGTKVLTKTVQLVSGDNTIAISASNDYGNDNAAVVIKRIGQISLPKPPTVNILEPANNSISNKNTTALVADVLMVTDKSQITVKVNGNIFNNFTYDKVSKKINGTVSLNPGSNTISVKATNSDGTDDASTNVRYNAPAATPPVVTITSPANNSVVTKPLTGLVAEVLQVTDKSQITVKVNGVVFSNFTYDPASHKVNGSINLITGANTISVKATNSDGSDEATVTVRYTPPAPPLPVITLTAPANNSNVTKLPLQVTATIENINSKADITFTVNGTNNTQFNFNATTKAFEASVNLQGGTNSIRIKAVNSAGSDEETLTLRYTVPAPPPEVVITTPATNPFNSSQAQTAVRATVTNVSSQSNITVTVNAKPFTGFTYNSVTKVLDATISLAVGKNDVVIKAATLAGTDQASVAINYEAPKPPVVQIITPKNGSTVNTPAQTVTANINGVKGASDITFTVNGNNITGFTFSKGSFSGSCALKLGVNTIKITARNTDGSDDASVSVTYAVPQLKPVVTFVSPKKPGMTYAKANIQVTANVQNVTDKKNIVFKVNGKAYPNFQFDAKSGVLTASILLNKGSNTLSIDATNSAGTGTAASSVKFEEDTPEPPVVTILSLSQPTANPMNPELGRSSLIATVENTMGRKSITLTVNGQAVTTYTFDNATNTLQHVIDLQRGVNTIKIKATNADGVDEETRTVEW